MYNTSFLRIEWGWGDGGRGGGRHARSDVNFDGIIVETAQQWLKKHFVVSYRMA